MVRSIGFEPIHPEETDLQSAAALQLYRLRIKVMVPGRHLQVSFTPA